MKKKIIKPVLSAIIIGFFLILAIASLENNSSTSTSSVNVSVEDVKIVKEHSNAWAVKGKIRNNTTRPIKGAVKIKFINSKGDIVHNNRAFVNGGDSFDPGQAANFEYFTDPKTFDDVIDFKVEFYER